MFYVSELNLAPNPMTVNKTTKQIRTKTTSLLALSEAKQSSTTHQSSPSFHRHSGNILPTSNDNQAKHIKTR